jgi:hypothetical protein
VVDTRQNLYSITCARNGERSTDGISGTDCNCASCHLISEKRKYRNGKQDEAQVLHIGIHL